MSEANVIEVWGESVALALEVKGGFRFVAATSRVAALDGKFYPTFGHARLAAIQQTKAREARGARGSQGRSLSSTSRRRQCAVEGIGKSRTR